jgi:hypothetical protein
MTKSDLKTGMRVTNRAGTKFLVLKDFKHEYDISSNVLVGLGYCGWWNLKSFKEDLTGEYSNDDIMKVEIPYHCYDVTGVSDKSVDPTFGYHVLWERDNPKEVTIKDIEDKFGCKVKIVS